MTYNVCNGLARPDRLARSLRRTDADLVALQELALPQARAIAEDLADLYPYQFLCPTGFTGKGLLSRYPILSQEELPLYPRRPDLAAVVDVDGLPLTVLVAHPPPPRLRIPRPTFDPAALAQVAALVELASERRPTLLLGDFNLTPRTSEYRLFVAAGLVDAFAAGGSGSGWTLPRRVGRHERFNHRLHWLPLRPVVRVDYIWCTRGFHVDEAWVGDDAGSDHLPVVAQITLPSVDLPFDLE
jgi:endonuclease/exonuclease/phosphatase family metal-dependent hydrolase